MDIIERISDLKKYERYQELDSYENIDSTDYNERKEIHWYFKEKYAIRLFECNPIDVYDKIFEE